MQLNTSISQRLPVINFIRNTQDHGTVAYCYVFLSLVFAVFVLQHHRNHGTLGTFFFLLFLELGQLHSTSVDMQLNYYIISSTILFPYESTQL